MNPTEMDHGFPSSTAGTTFAQHAQYVDQWNREVLSAAQIASRQETVLDALDQSAAAAQKVLAQSQSASGELAQLQLIVQMLGIVHTPLVTINQTLATTGRVLTDMAAVSASSSQLSQTKKAASRRGSREGARHDRGRGDGARSRRLRSIRRPRGGVVAPPRARRPTTQARELLAPAPTEWQGYSRAGAGPRAAEGCMCDTMA